MEEKFALTLIKHRRFGDIIVPYWIEKSSDKVYYAVKERITSINISTFQDRLTKKEIEIITLIEQYSDQTLVKLFSKKNKSVKDFIHDVDKNYIEDNIRPYIERRIANLIPLLLEQDIPFFHKIENNLHDSDKIQWAGENTSTIFNFVRQPEGTQYFLTIQHQDKTINLNNKAGQIICNDPCILVLENTLFRFNDIDGKKLLPFFTKESVFVNKQAEEKYYSSFVLNAIKKYQVHTTGFQVETLRSKPRALLFIEHDLSQLPVLALKFDYGLNTTILANRKDQKIVSFKKDDYSFRVIERDSHWEEECQDRLEKLGLLRKNKIFFILPEITDKETGIYFLIQWLNENKSMLEKNGFVLKQQQLQRTYFTGDFDLVINVDDVSDWFDIKAYVRFENMRISFTSFRHNILRGIREYELPNGEIFILPEEWFSRYRDLFTFAEDKEESLKLRKLHFTVIQESTIGLDKKKYNRLSDLSLETLEKEQPKGIEATLRPYQLDGYSWMKAMQEQNFGICLADDMGLGKTLQTLSLLQAAFENGTYSEERQGNEKETIQLSLFADGASQQSKSVKGINKPILIVLPTSLVHNWLNEIQKFIPTANVSLYVGINRDDFSVYYKKKGIILTTYGLVRNEIEVLSKYPFYYLILDESQAIKNPESKTYQSVMKLKADHRLVLTGTPIENSLSDLWAQMNFINPGILGSHTFFKNEFITPIESKGSKEQQERLKQLIQPFILRRTKTQVASDLPPLNEQTVFCDMPEDQQYYYEVEKSKVRNSILENIGKQGVEKSTMIILQALTRLRQIANHPKLVESDYEGESGKFEDVTRKLENLQSENHKVLIFSSFVKHLNLLEAYFEQQGFNYELLTGKTKNREKVIERFQRQTDINFFLISLKAGGVGLNLTAADYVFILDPWWNPASEQQAIARAHRIGQKSKVFVYRFISSETIEEKIIRLQQKKHQLADTFVNSNNPFKGLSKDHVMELFD